jgi:serine/threonine protein phosphatase 1
MKNHIRNIENTFVIGDVHGCYHTLMQLVKQLPLDANLLFVGDLCDKGNFSKEVIEFVKNNNHACVKGNHEVLYERNIIDAVILNITSEWSSDLRYGGKNTIQSYHGDLNLIKKHLEWIKEFTVYIQIGKYFVTHGFGLEFYKNRDKKEYYDSLLSNRYFSDTIEPKISEDIINVFGHCIFEDVQKGEKYFCIDTGCSNGSKLTYMQL